MKHFIRIISFVLIFVICLGSFSFAYAAQSGDFVSSYDFWGWIADHTQAFWDLLGVTNVFSSASDSCNVSEDHLHHASSGTPYRTSGSLSGGNVVFSCHCDYCGMLFDATMPYEEFIDKSKSSYDTYVNDTVQSELGTTVVGKNGYRIPLYFPDPNYSPPDLVSSKFTYSFSSWTLYSSKYMSSVSVLFCPEYGYIGDLTRFTFPAPVDGYYSVVYSLDCQNCYLSRGPGVRQFISSGKDLRVYFTWSFYVKIDNSFTTGSFTISDCYFLVEPSEGYDVNDFTQEVGGTDSRSASFTGDLGIMGDNGQLTKVEGDQIFNETTNNYYNPVTNNTTNITDWTYDYSDRSYNLTTEEGDTITVTYGDENITIQEGDQTYNVYYIITNESGGSQGGGGEGGDGGGGEATDPTHTHSWGEPTDSTPPTCTAPGSKTYTCSECGETKTETVPATGHKWVVKQTVQTKYDESGQLIQEGYTLYECSVCGEQYKSTDGTGPPGSGGSGSGGGSGDDGGESIWDKLGKLFGTLGSGLLELLGAVVGKLLDGLISLAELIAEKLVDVVNLVLGFFDEIPKLFTGFLAFLTAVFPFLPPEIMTLLTFGIAAIVFIGIVKAVRR